MRVQLRVKLATHVLAVAAAVQCIGAPDTIAQTGTAPALLPIPAVTRAPTFEDFLTGEPREAEARVTGFRQYEPVDGAPASQETIAYLSHDAEHLYVAFVCHDNPAKVRAHLSRREDIEGDDQVVVHLDTFHDRRHAFSFFVNPLGVQRDSLWTEGQGGDATFDTVWHTRGRVTANGYVVWIAIPFRSLRFPRAPLQRWGIALGRVIARTPEMANWPYITQRVESYARQFATLEGLEGISQGRNAQVIPYAAATGARVLLPGDSAGSLFRHEREGRAGFDAKLVVRNALTLDGTVNPDFSHVESDEPQVTINQRFEVFFPEKRPFFIENAGMFETPVNLFFSRRVQDPRAGARLTGTLGGWSVAALFAQDRDGPIRPRAAVARVQRQFRNQSTLGLVTTTRDTDAESNQVFSVDARVKAGPNWVLTGQAIQTRSRAADGQVATGPGLLGEISHSGLHLGYTARYSDRSPRFRSALGFVPRVDVRQAEQTIRYYWRPRTGPVLFFGPELTFTMNWDRRGRVQDRIVDVSFGGNFKGPVNAGCRHVAAFELFRDLEFTHRKSDCGAYAAWLRWLELSVDYARGTSVNYLPASGLSPFVAPARSASVTATFRSGRRVRLAETYLHTGLRRVFDNHIWRSKLSYQLTRELSLRLIADYQAVLPNSTVIAVNREKRLTGDLLVTYLVNPGTAVYAGYSDRYENLTFSGVDLVREGAPDLSTGRQAYLKVSYLIRF